jgi:primosomal protein N' (replication factor Y) (superfamily II helicase)
MPIAKVEPLTTARSLRGPFDYALPDRFPEVGVGSLLVVPFGRRRVLGVVVKLADSSELPPERLAEPIEAREAGAPPELVKLGLWVAREYCSTPSRGLELALPPGAGTAGRGVGPRIELRARITPLGISAVGNGARLGARQRAALELLSEGAGELSARELASGAAADRATLRRLEARGLVALAETELRRRPDVRSVGAPARPVRLNPAQERALRTIVTGLDAEPRSLLLHGVTGSGKTEVYLAAVGSALERGRGAIVLVPEIGLTPQTLGRFRARFGERVAVLHSRLGAGERRDEWERLRAGDARVCVGPRSAVFAPIAGLGLIVIDEEHDPSYKQEGDPRYDARAVARRRAGETGATLVAGSATPRPESWRTLERLALPDRADGRSLPEVEVLDMRHSADGLGARAGPLHPRTREELARVARAGAKAIVMLNRRGWAPHLACRSCGRAWTCPNCDVSLVVHRASETLRCHHCGHGEPTPQACVGCGSVTLARAGAGTERIEAELRALVEPLPVLRLDSDSAVGSAAHAEILGRFDDADAGILVGTQMVAKGHDFPEVVLSVMVDADASLRFPDLRAEERTFALVSQLAGRSGRGERGGRVLVQTLAPDAPAIRHAAAHDAAGFLDGELDRRRALGYPPFGHLVRIELTAPEAAVAARAAARVAARLAPALPEDARLLGPAPRFRLRDRHRRQLLVKARERTPAVAAVRDAVEALARGGDLRGAALAVDVDP